MTNRLPGCAIGSARMLLAMLALWLLAGAVAQAAEHGVERVRFWRYGVEDGLSQSTARAIVQDTDGFVWIGTQDGLNRFDGQEFRVYRHEALEADSLSDNHVTALARTRDGGVWVGTMAGGLSRYQRYLDAFVSYRPQEGAKDALADRQVTALLADSRSRLWVASGAGRLQWLDQASAVFRDVPATDTAAWQVVRALRERRDGRILVVTRGGVWQLERDGSAAVELRAAQDTRLDAYDAIEVEGGHVWVATAGQGAVQFDADGKEVRRLTKEGGELADNDVRTLLRDRQARLWFGTFNGLTRLERTAAAPETWNYDVANPAGVASNRIQSLMEDRDGLVWVGTWLNGLSLFNPRTESFHELHPDPRDPQALPGSGVASVMSDADGTLWLGVLEGGGLVHFDLGKGVLQRFTPDPAKPDSLSHAHVSAMARTSAGTLWVGTLGGLDRMRADGSGFDHFRHDPADPASLASNAVNALLVDRQGDLWVGTLSSGLDRRCARCEGFEHFPADPAHPQSVGGAAINSLYEDQAGNVWVALRPGGLARFARETGRFEHHRSEPSQPDGLSHDTVTVLREDAKSRLWVGTQGGGLNELLRTPDGVRFRAITSRDGLAADAIGGIAPDRNGRLWVSTTQGVSRIDPEARSVVNFDRRDGVQSRGYFIGASAILPDQRVVFGGVQGATVFDPMHIDDLDPLHPVRITATRALLGARRGRGTASVSWRLPPDQAPELSLSQAADAVALEFSALNYGNPERVEYSYRLLGMDDRWVNVDSRRRIAMFTSLPPGSFAFQVRARTRGGDWGAPTELTLRHLPSPWQTPWARAAYALVAGAVLLAIAWNLRARLRERRRAERTLRNSEERLKLALWGSGDELWDMDLHTREMRRENPLRELVANAESYLIDAAELRNTAHAEDLALFDRAFADVMAGRVEILDVTYRARARDGSWRWLHSRGRVVQRDADGRPARMVGTTEDVSELKEHELALERINQDLERRVADRTADLTVLNNNLKGTIAELRSAQRQLVDSEKMAALGGLVAGIAHEINTPLGISVTAASHLETEARRIGEQMAADTLKRSDLERYQHTALESSQMILRNLQRADKLVRSFKQVAVDQSSEQRRMVNLREYLDEILTSLHPALKKTRHQVVIECPEQLVLDTYPGAIYQIVVNLAMNSLQHGFEGMDAGTITIRGSLDGEDWLLDYRDDGRGMSAEVRARVFEPFYTTKRGRGGSGLGLHIVFNLTNQVLRGTLSCESEPGKGARFVLRCPIAPT